MLTCVPLPLPEQIGEEHSLAIKRVAIDEGWGCVKPGWARVNFNYFIDDIEAAFIMRAVLQVRCDRNHYNGCPCPQERSFASEGTHEHAPCLGLHIAPILFRLCRAAGGDARVEAAPSVPTQPQYWTVHAPQLQQGGQPPQYCRDQHWSGRLPVWHGPNRKHRLGK